MFGSRHGTDVVLERCGFATGLPIYTVSNNCFQRVTKNLQQILPAAKIELRQLYWLTDKN
jgi:hypothetical protein